jgi:hypothetical protein
MRRVLITLSGLWLLLAGGIAWAQCTSTGVTANWSLNTTWSNCGGGTPGAASNVVINNNVTVNVASSALSVTHNAGTVTQSSTLAIGAGGLVIAGGTFNSTNGLTVTGTTQVNSGSLNINNATGTRSFTGNVTIGGTWGNAGNETITFGGNLTNNGSFQSGTIAPTFSAATATLSGSNAITFTGGVIVTNALTINMGAAGTTVTMSGASSVGTNLLITQGTLSSGANLTVGGTTTLGTTGPTTGNFTITAGATHTHTGNVTITQGTWNNSGNLNVGFGGNFTNNAPLRPAPAPTPSLPRTRRSPAARRPPSPAR